MLKSLLQSIVGRFMPTIGMAPGTAAPTIPDCAPTTADHLQRRQRAELDKSVHCRMAIEGFNAWHARAGTGLKAEPIGTSSISIDAAAAAVSFARWAAEHQLACELKVDDLWALVAEDLAPAHNWILPPRRVFLGALQRVPGVKVVYDRRIYGRDGRVRRKTTVYTLPPRTAPSASALPACAEKSTGVGTAAASLACRTMQSEVHEAHPASSWIEPVGRHPRRACTGRRHTQGTGGKP